MKSFLELFNELVVRSPGSIEAAIQLNAAVQKNFPGELGRVSIDAIWQVAWDKPLFANIKVQQALVWRERLLEDHGCEENDAPPLDVLAGVDVRRFRIERFGARNFQEFGSRAAVPAKRLYSIQSVAQCLLLRMQDEKPFDALENLQFEELMYWVGNAFGYGWGPVTTCHFLADCGVAVKPDLHLVRAVNHIYGTEYVDQPALNDIVQIQVLCRRLLTEIPDGYPQTLRFLDKVLMEISRQGLLYDTN